jgi:hypothetical protein
VRAIRRSLPLFAVLLVAGCSSTPGPFTPTQTNPPGTSAVGSCHARGALPDPSCTPGVTNLEVTQENIFQTICVPGWTRTIRPPTSYTNALKLRQMAEYGIQDLPPSAVEEDHLIPLAVGGHPTDPRNLWPEPWDGPDGAHAKDRIENALHRLVCSGQMTLEEAQRRIGTDWTTALP